MRFDLVVFDLDGTLIDSRGDIAGAANAALAAFGLPSWPDEIIESMVGEGARLLAERGIAGRLPPERTDDVFRRYAEHYGAHRTDRTTVYPGVREGLSRLDPARRFIATNKPAPLARAIVEDLGLGPFFDGVLGDGDVERRKPDPAMLGEAMRRAGVPRERTVYVGDGPIDLQTADRAGVPLILVDWGFRKEEVAEARPAFRAGSFDEIVAIVRGDG